MAAVAGQVGERLGHEGRDQPALLGERLDHVAKEDRAIARGQRVGELEVLLELAVGVLVVGRVVVPAERRSPPWRPSRRSRGCGSARACRSRADRACRARRRPRSRRRRSGGRGSTRARRRPSARSPSSAARASAWRRIVRGQNGHCSPSTVTSQANRATFGCHGRIVSVRRVGHRDHVGVVRALADVAGGEAGEAGAVARAGRRGDGQARASRSACRACRRTARTGTRCRWSLTIRRTSSAFWGGVVMEPRYIRRAMRQAQWPGHPVGGA